MLRVVILAQFFGYLSQSVNFLRLIPLYEVTQCQCTNTFVSIINKAQLRKVGIFFFALNFLPWEFLLIKKLEIEKTETTQYTTFKTDILYGLNEVQNSTYGRLWNIQIIRGLM